MKKAVLVLFVFCTAAMGQTVTPEMRTAANEAYQKQDWKTAATAYEGIVKVEEKNVGANYRLGVSYFNLNETAKAAKHLEVAMTISPNAVFALALARAEARGGQKEKVYAVFERSVPLGGIAAESLNDEKDFAAMKAEPKFAEYVKKLDTLANPCRNKPEFRQFDFWIGEWLPKNVQGVTVGTSSIQLILSNCIIFENWETPVSAGKSFNVFDVRDGKWHQTWVDNKGLMTHYVGGLVDGKMVLDSESVQNGVKTIGRMTYSKLDNGDVRQHGENSTDGGKTWTTTFDFIYVRVK
ncbi:MAG: tetratricopeptide repeat protein [bacterium]|nr:tetratricopeptide repeat protein [bacterium]